MNNLNTFCIFIEDIIILVLFPTNIVHSIFVIKTIIGVGLLVIRVILKRLDTTAKKVIKTVYLITYSVWT